MVHTRSIPAGNSSLPHGQGQPSTNLPPLIPPQIPTPLPPQVLIVFPPVDHAEGGDENQLHASAHNSTSTANQDVVTAQLAAMQQQFGVFQLNPQPVQPALAISESQGQSHIAPTQQPIPDDVTRRLDSLEKLVAEHRGAPPLHHAADSIPHPLNTNITLEPYPAGFKIPQLETYDGTKDPDDHLHAFYSCMQAQNASDALPPRSISSYTEMAFAFPTKFSSRRLIRKTTSELMRVKQRDGESLKNYMSRFNDAVLEVSSFDQAVRIVAVIFGLKHDRFRDSLIKHAATTFSEVNDRKRMRMVQNRGPMLTSPTRVRKPNSTPLQQSAGKPPVNWTPFNLPRSQIFMHIKNKMDLRRPGPMRTAAASRDHTRYCDFHQDHGHTIKQCNSLRSELESLAQKGMLNEYVQRAEQPRFVREQRPQPQGVRNPPNRQRVGYQQAPPLLPPPARIIHMITGGLEAGGLSSKQRKLYVREVKHQNRAQKRKIDDAEWKTQPITFTSANLDTVVTPHNDPLVTSVIINNCEVQRVLVDIGSAPDIMYFHCFESLGLDPALLQKYDGPIYGFNNQPVPVEGVLTLHVAFGSGRTYVTPSVRFLVVKMASFFNIVIGRPTLTEIQAVVSQSHLCMKFPTPMGIATLQGNQEVARHRYITSVTQPTKGKDQTPEAISQRILDNQQAIKEEVEKLLQAGFVRKVDYCEWVANPVLVKKANGNERLSLLDAYSGYHQVPMAPEDEEKTSFYAGDEIYCYVMMPFGLKNAGATYQKMVTIVFRAQIGKNLEVYVDDIVVKSRKAEDHLADLDETFNNLRKNRMRLNLAKCIFGVESGKFLGFMVSRRGIEVNPEKIRVIAEMEPPKSVKDIQRLTGRVAALYRFISKLADKCLPFFKIMRSATQKDESGKQKKFEWSQECQTAFDELKSYLSSPPLLTKAIDGEILYLYLGISDEAISSVLVREEAKQQKPIYYISSVLHGAELRYPIAEKAALAVVTSARKLRPYFQSHPIIVLKDQPLRQILQKPECSGRLIKWAVELGEFQITFQQRSAIQALADFIVECTPCPSTSNPEPNDWTLYVDGASSSKGSGAGALLIGPEGYRSEHALKSNFDATNNMAEYEALLLVVDPVMVKYVALVAELKCKFQKFCLSKIPRAENEQANSLSKFASDSSLSSRSVFVEILDEPSFMKPRVMEISTNPDTPSWTDSIVSFLRDGIVPEDRQEAMKLRKKASRYTLVDGVLYKRSFSLPLLRCLNPYEAEYALREVHEGVCGSHVGARTLAHKVLRQGYYWPNMHKDATYFVQKCPKCQFFAHLTHQPTEELTNMVAPWPFAQWGLDLLGPFVKGVGGVTHLVVGVDYFTKWVEARPLSSLTFKKVEDFVFNSIICRYGIPNQIVADNGTQFSCSSFRDFCSSYGIKLQFTSVYHPKSNGMVESVNKCILEGIKPRLEQHKAKWVDELNNVLWAYRTTSRTATGETPYHLAFGTEAVILVEIGVPSLRVTHFDEGRNGQLFRENLDLLAEVREEARL
ncbi:hypothetical protein SLEP1_g24648 [Rubroshorea leprosula]|uniref:Integrase catalytic domain-containing protein n=1 Tax=Rubroshorea leprosula TaxID=152421 RepID=A0AAV5JMK0_9ROSI|nr:hypothetical protein SLEP1_g24648 [Rubroshorea leprosula]